MLGKLRKLVLQIIVGVVGIWLASELVEGTYFDLTSIKILFLAGAILGFINFFIKPILNLVTLPLRVITFGLFSLLINMGIVWIMDVLFLEFEINGLYPLLWTTLTIWILSIIASKI